MRFGLLGPLEAIDDDGAAIDLGGRQPRTMVAMLLAASGRVVSADAIVEAIWGDDPPAGATSTIHSYVSRLRRKFDASRVVREGTGYRLDVDASDVDFRRFEQLAGEGRALLDAGRAEEGRAALVAADALWRGAALVEHLDQPFAVGLATRLEEQRLAALEDRIGADLSLGRHANAVGELAELVRAHPLREGLRAHLALALYRSGRQADALRAIEDARRTLRDELGVDPGRPLRELESAILAHRRSLDLPATEPRADRPGIAVDVRQVPVPTGLIGRDVELAHLVQALDEARSAARFVVIEGEPGVGKTRLADELRAVAEGRGAVSAWGRSYEGGAAPALWPWLAPLRALAGGGRGDASLDWLLTDGGVTADAPDPLLRFERFEGIAAFLERVATEAPVLLLVDDLQWADEASLDLLAFLSGRLERGVLLVATMRQLEVGRKDALVDALAEVARRPGNLRVQLRGLNQTDTVALLDRTTGRAIDRGVADAIHARSDGNPFFAVELARLLLDEDVAEADAVATADVPAGVGDVVRRRLGRLPEATVELLTVAAVLGRDIDLGLLTRTAELPIDACLDRLEPAVVHRLLADVPGRPSTFRFSHALVREVLLEDVSSLRRARLHLRAADAIEAAGVREDDAEVLAEHLWRAAPVGGGQRAADALERAAEVAVNRVAFASAEDLLGRAVELRRATSATDDDLEVELRTITRLLGVARVRRYFAGAAKLAVLSRAKELAQRIGRRDVLYDLLWGEWVSAATSCDFAEATPLAQSLRELLIAEDEVALQAVGHSVWGVECWHLGHMREAQAELDRSHELWPASVPSSMALQFAAERHLLARTFRIFVRAANGVLDDPKPEFDALIATGPDAFTAATIHGFACTTAIAHGLWDRAADAARRGIATDPHGDFSFWGGHVRMNLGVVLVNQGDLEEGTRLFELGRGWYTGIGARSGVAQADASFAMGLAAWGRVEDAVSAVAEARRELETYGERWNEPIVLIAEGVVAHHAGDPARAADRLALAAEVATRQGSVAFAARAGAVAAELGIAP